ncbi:MAG: hypothetical protein M1118_05890 [Chloroflexi bacterium]|nr:hypothetical protein [Chloroflexota bacterium]
MRVRSTLCALLLAVVVAAPSLLVAAGAPNGVGTWTPLAETGAPGANAFHTAVWTGREMLIWGGGPADAPGNRGSLGAGATYTPGRHTWQSITRYGAPSVRSFHTAVWTGREMLIWGGIISAFIRDNGGSYDPSTDRWTAIAPWPDLSGRYGHTAVWTGREMLIWGGNGGPPYQYQGAAYDPSTRSWRLLPNASFLSRRWWHTAVWTGREMLIWGGQTVSQIPAWIPQDTGGRYNPATNTWQPIASTGAPGPRYGHTAVWTGSEMLIWGGKDAKGYLGDGAAYDPRTNTWRPLPMAGAPSPRARQTAVWTGTAMLVWGGENAHGTLGDGAAYDPRTNTWTPLPAAGAPSARAWQTAVWTGSSMIVWGGCGRCGESGTRFIPLGDGAVYTPPLPPSATPVASPVRSGRPVLPETGGGWQGRHPPGR